MALPKANRLKHRNDFNVVYQRGSRRKSPHLTLISLKHRSRAKQAKGSGVEQFQPVTNHLLNQVPTKIGISISQKVSKRAVIRNRIKRQIRAAMRHFLPAFAVGWDLVIVVQPSAIQCDYSGFLRELEQLLIDAEVLNGH